MNVLSIQYIQSLVEIEREEMLLVYLRDFTVTGSKRCNFRLSTHDTHLHEAKQNIFKYMYLSYITIGVAYTSSSGYMRMLAFSVTQR